MIDILSESLKRAKYVFRTEGLAPLLARGFDFARRRLFMYIRCYLYEHTLEERNEADFMPRIQDFTFKIIFNNAEADELAATMGYDFRQRFVTARRSLDKGAIVFCIFANGEIAHTVWVALNEEARESIDLLSYEVDFPNGEACTGGMWTSPKYRGMGLASYMRLKRCQFLRESGRTIVRSAVAMDNIVSQGILEKLGARIYAEGRYLRIAWWSSWKEKPLSGVLNEDSLDS